MAVRDNHQLQQLFPDWSLSHRVIIWLWLGLHARVEKLDLGSFDAPSMGSRMAEKINQLGLIDEINNWQNHPRLPDQSFDWIEKKGRQPAWLLRQFERANLTILTRPINLIPRDKLIVLFDIWNADKPTKQHYLNQLKSRWVQQQLQDKQLSWYTSAGKEKEKSQIAWQWYQDHHPSVAVLATEFSTIEDIFEFLDDTRFSPDEKRYHLEQIKKKFRAHQTQANREGKKQTNISLSAEARRQLDGLAKKGRRTKTEVIELLIQNAHESGMPH